MKLKLLFLLTFIFLSADAQDFPTIRKNYLKAVSDKKICKEMIHKLEKKNAEGLQLAYYGAFQALWAKHAGNPLEKLSTFKKGKNNIDKAVKQQPKDLEARFLRYSIQKESPGFLGYKSNVAEDRAMLSRNIENVDDPALKQMIIQILKSKS